MTKFTKIISVALSLILLFSCFGIIPASAADVNYSVTNVSGKKGDTVTVSVKISSSKAIWGANVSLAYNGSELQYVSSELGSSASSGSLYNTGSAVNFSGMYKNTSGTVFTVKFKILKDSGTSTLKVTSTENIDYNENKYTAAVTNGTVTVLEDSDFALGDVNGDGKVSAVDARLILQSVAGIKTLTSDELERADISADGRVSAVDARRILQIVAGL